MDQHAIVTFGLWIGAFLVAAALVQEISKRFSALPFTVLILLLGFMTQFIVHYLNLDIHISLPHNLIYFILLPLLLFESALHINFHQFKLQFKTITAFATIGLMLSVVIIGYGLHYTLNLDLQIALLFAALISSTDPIAVIALFKSLGAPKRLGLVADGESMFNDATGVIAFKLVSAFVFADVLGQQPSISSSVINFFYLFIGSILFGAAIGYLFSKIVENIKDDFVVELMVSLSCAIIGFIAAEHFLHLSGVISSVCAGVVFGNLGRTKLSASVHHSLEQFWSAVAFLGVSLVFFFASYNLDLGIFIGDTTTLLIVVAIVLIARAISVYVTAFFTNRAPFFKDEPNLPQSWLHILNWGGLRGVIPLILVYSLPLDFSLRDDFFRYTFAALLFTLFFNGLSIRFLLMKLGLHVPNNEVMIQRDQERIFAITELQHKLDHLESGEFEPTLIEKVQEELRLEEKELKQHLKFLANPKDLFYSFRWEALEIERQSLAQLYKEGTISERTFYDFDAELDLQQDALEFGPEPNKEGFSLRGYVNTKKTFRHRLIDAQQKLGNIPFIDKAFGITPDRIVRDRIELLRARILTSNAVIAYFKNVKGLMKDIKGASEMITKVEESYNNFEENDNKQLSELYSNYPQVAHEYQEKLVYALLNNHTHTIHH